MSSRLIAETTSNWKGREGRRFSASTAASASAAAVPPASASAAATACLMASFT